MVMISGVSGTVTAATTPTMPKARAKPMPKTPAKAGSQARAQKLRGHSQVLSLPMPHGTTVQVALMAGKAAHGALTGTMPG